MKYVIVLVSFFLCVIASAETFVVKTQNFVDRVHQIKITKEKSYIIFYREPVLYNILPHEEALLKKLEQSQKSKKPLVVTVDPLTKHILKVKGP